MFICSKKDDEGESFIEQQRNALINLKELVCHGDIIKPAYYLWEDDTLELVAISHYYIVEGGIYTEGTKDFPDLPKKEIKDCGEGTPCIEGCGCGCLIDLGYEYNTSRSDRPHCKQ